MGTRPLQLTQHGTQIKHSTESSTKRSQILIGDEVHPQSAKSTPEPDLGSGVRKRTPTFSNVRIAQGIQKCNKKIFEIFSHPVKMIAYGKGGDCNGNATQGNSQYKSELWERWRL